MGLLDWFRSAASSGGDKDISTVTLDKGESAEVAGLNFQEAVAAHQRWKARLQACIDGTRSEKLDPAIVGRDDQCVLGKWIHGQGAATFGDLPVFSELKAGHAEFHRVAGEVLTSVYAGRAEEAAKVLGSTFAQASVKVLGLLASLFLEARH